jgi:hypothetical protein
MLLVMSMHVFTGLRLFCASDVFSIKDVPILVNPEHVGSVNESWVDDDKPNCSCKKHKRCLPSPRALITSNSSSRFLDYQRQLSFVSAVSRPDQNQVVKNLGQALARNLQEDASPDSPLISTCILLI